MHDHRTNLVTRMYWRLADQRPEALVIALLTAAVLVGHLLAKLTMWSAL